MIDHPAADRQKAERLRTLHQGAELLVLPNAWDVGSARVFEAAGFPALATTSAGIAYAMGYPDGERISRREMVDVVRRIARAVSVPVTADMEAGYGPTPADAAATAVAVIEAGAVGMNLEDSNGPGEEHLVPLERQVLRVHAARDAAERLGVPIVVNARTDVFAIASWSPERRLEEAVRRGTAYLEAGGDCIFVPFVSSGPIIEQLVQRIGGPVNILGTPDGPPLAELGRLGVRRVSIGSGAARASFGMARRIATELKDAGTFELVRQWAIPYPEMQQLLQP